MSRRFFVGVAAAVASMLVVGVSAASGSGVDPNPYSATVASGSSVTITKTVHTPAIPPNPDIVLLADNTGSMFSAVSNVASNATAIMNNISGGVPSGSVAEFAAADYMDGDPAFCPSDPWAFNVDQGLTATTSDVQNGINTWPTHVSTFAGGVRHSRVMDKRVVADRERGDRLPLRLDPRDRAVRRRDESRSELRTLAVGRDQRPPGGKDRGHLRARLQRLAGWRPRWHRPGIGSGRCHRRRGPPVGVAGRRVERHPRRAP